MRICAGALLVRGSEMLLVRRSDDRPFYPGVWDVVGGHCEAGETPAETLTRELAEELGIEPVVFEPVDILHEPHPAEHGDARYHIFVVTAWSGVPRLRNAEHSELRWVTLDEALTLTLAHPDYVRLFAAVLDRPNVLGARRRIAVRGTPMNVITVHSKHHDQVIDITDQLAPAVAAVADGVCTVFTQHTTCALTILTNEAGIADDLLTVLRRLVPQVTTYVHDSADHVRAHVLSALVGPSVSAPVRHGRMALGQFQRIVLLEFEGPRERAVSVTTTQELA